MSREIVTSAGGKSRRRRTCLTSQPTASPTAIPPATLSRNELPASHSENVPLTAATTPKR